MILDDGTRFCGYSFGAHKCIGGEVVFNTAMTGYTESLTDPSYAGQIMVLTYPLIGNYGVPASDLWESEHIHAEALIVRQLAQAGTTSSHYGHRHSRPYKITARTRCDDGTN